MKSLNFHTILKKTENGWNLLIHNRENIILQLIEYFTLSLDDKITEIWFDTKIKQVSENKTNPQLGYYHAEILQKALYGFQQAGYSDYDIDSIHFILKYKFHYELVYIPDEDTYQRMPLSLAEASKESMSEFIEKTIDFIQTELLTRVLTPEEYYGLKEKFSIK